MNETLIADVQTALARHGVQCQQIDVLSPPGTGRKRLRTTLRVSCTDGSLIKVRRLENAEAASQLVAHRRRAPAPFVPVLACYEAILIEPWIAGLQLTPCDAEQRAEELGAMLGSLHALRWLDVGPSFSSGAQSARPEGRAYDMSRHVTRALAHIDELVSAGAIAPEAAGILRVELQHSQPPAAGAALVHLDYCPENIVVDARGRLHVIDNEWMRVDAPGLDLGRTYARWGMSQDAWPRFLRGYLANAPRDPGPLRFWQIVMAVAGAALRLHRTPADRAVSLSRLLELTTTPQV